MSETKTPETPKTPEVPKVPEATPKAPEQPKKVEPTLVELVQAKIEKITKYQLGSELVGDEAIPRFKGKPGMNPYLYLKQVVEPIGQHIKDSLEKGVKPDETLLRDFVSKIPDEVAPAVDKMDLNVKTLRQLMVEFNSRKK